MTVVRSKGKQCRGKARHDSEYDARISARENHGENSAINVYLCPHCGFWHIGHKIKEAA